MLNQGALNAEKQTYRIYLAGAGPTVHPILGSIPSQGSIPLPMQGTGTVATVNLDPNNGCLVIGTNTLFLNDTQIGSKTKFTGQVEPGEYSAVNVNGQFLRRITEVKSDTRLMIEAPFPSSLNGNFYIVKKARYKMIYAKSVGTGNAILQEQTFVSGETFLNGGAPVTYDVTGSNAGISFQIDY
jgi:hypothetical protein